jgi:hypothetical protein
MLLTSWVVFLLKTFCYHVEIIWKTYVPLWADYAESIDPQGIDHVGRV